MMNFKSFDTNRKLHWGIGGFVFIVSLIVYFRTVAPTTSFWDCGEFIACSRILGVMHPPGAPLYLLIGRILTLLPFFGDIGLRVNVFSVWVSAATVLLTYLIIAQLIRRWRGQAQTWEDRVILYASAAFGALAFAFTDSFWFNAVEAEVYSFSMFFVAAVIWLALVWGERSEKASSLLIIIFIFYLFGLAAGVHLLNILAFPFVLLVAFFHDNQKVRRLLLLLTIQAGVPIFLYMVIFQFDASKMQYANQILEHQGKASSFMKWFGTIWLVVTMAYMYRKDRSVFKVWFLVPAMVALAYSTYLVIYIRAGLNPPINENDPSTASGMMDYLARKQYGTEDSLLTFLHRKADFWGYQIHQMFTRYFGWQFIGRGIQLDRLDRIVEVISFRGLYGIPFLIGLWGAVHHFFKDWKRAVAVLVLFFILGYGIILYVNQPDPQPRERDYSYVGAFFAFALWIGIGMVGILEWISDALRKKESLKKIVYAATAVVLFVAVPLNLLAFNYESHDRSGNYVAWDYSYNILQTCEPDAIIFTNGDNDTFPLWYLQEVEGIRKDVRVVCLSLLNTHWYIKQLRDLEPKVPMGLTNRQIEKLYPTGWQTQQMGITVSKSVQERERQFLKETLGDDFSQTFEDTIKFELAPTFPDANPQGLRVQDLMVLRILQASQWQRPVYFAVTVSNQNQLNLHRYMRMDGLAYKIVPYPVQDIHPQILRENVMEKYQFRGLDDPDVHFNVSTIKLLINARQAFLQLARYHLNKQQNEEAAFVLDEMARRIPEENIPYAHERIALAIAEHYKRAGLPGNHEERVKYVIPGRQMTRDDYVWMAGYYSQILDSYDKAEEIYLDLIGSDNNDVQAYSGLVQTYRWAKKYDQAAAILEDWIRRHPGDNNAVQELEAVKALAATAVDSTG